MNKSFENEVVKRIICSLPIHFMSNFAFNYFNLIIEGVVFKKIK